MQTINKSYKNNPISQINQSQNEYLNDQRINQISREPSPAIQNRLRTSGSKKHMFHNTTPQYPNTQGKIDNNNLIRNSGSNVKNSSKDNQGKSRIQSRYNSRHGSPGPPNHINEINHFNSHSKSPNINPHVNVHDTRSASKIIITDAGRSHEIRDSSRNVNRPSHARENGSYSP